MAQVKFLNIVNKILVLLGQLIKMAWTKGILDSVLLMKFWTHLAKNSKLAWNGEFYHNIARNWYISLQYQHLP
jgi:hypothetical protein